LNLHGFQQAQTVQYGLLELSQRVVESAWHQEALEPSPHPLNEVQVRTIRRQPLQCESPGLPILLARSNDPGCVKRGVVQNYHARLVLLLCFLRQGVQEVAEDFPAVARTLKSILYSNRSRSSPSTQSVPMNEVDAPLRTPPPLHPMLVSLPLECPGVRGSQTHIEAALVEVLQDDLAFLCPLFRASNSSLASRSASGSGALLGT
jgi:hypothetical protein